MKVLLRLTFKSTKWWIGEKINELINERIKERMNIYINGWIDENEWNTCY